MLWLKKKIYVIGGYRTRGPSLGTPNRGSVATNEEYDPATDTWTFKTPMPTPREGFGIAVYQNKIYCISGLAKDGYTGVNEVFDPATNTWETKASIPTPRHGLEANVVNGKIYLIGGYDFLNSTLNEVYDPVTDFWTTKTPMPTGASYFASAVFDNEIYVIYGGCNQIYNPETDSWSRGAPPPSNVFAASAGVTTGIFAPKRIYVLGVANERIYFADAQPCLTQVYDPERDNWIAGAPLNTNRVNVGVAVVNDMLYAIGGHTHGDFGYVIPSALNEQYTPIGYGTISPVVSVVSPESNKTYAASNVSLTFTVNKPAGELSYSLDGQDNVTITSNTTLTGLYSGLHNVTVYATDTFWNTGASETINFSVLISVSNESEYSPITWVAATVASVVAVGISLIVYFKKFKR